MSYSATRTSTPTASHDRTSIDSAIRSVSRGRLRFVKSFRDGVAVAGHPLGRNEVLRRRQRHRIGVLPNLVYPLASLVGSSRDGKGRYHLIGYSADHRAVVAPRGRLTRRTRLGTEAMRLVILFVLLDAGVKGDRAAHVIDGGFAVIGNRGIVPEVYVKICALAAGLAQDAPELLSGFRHRRE